MEALIESLKRHEGYRDHVYRDSLGNLTCGWGHYLAEGTPVPIEAAEAFFKQDLANAVNDFNRIERKYTHHLNEDRRRVIVEMIFNLGLPGVLKFKKMWICVEAFDFDKAAEEMLNSRWHTQVGNRAVELSEIMRKGGT